MRGSLVAGVLSAGLLAGSALAQDAVQWRVEDGGNGHWYQLIVESGVSVHWVDAQRHAAARGGYLATLTSSAENEFAFAVSNFAAGWKVLNTTPSYCIGPWLGGYQPPGSSEPAGGWRWVTDEPWSWSNWWAPALEPNNGCGGGEDFLHWLTQGNTNPSAAWNDTAIPGNCGFPTPNSYVLEYSADCNSDGIVDFGQIRAGELDDANANNIPDCCEQGVACNCPADIDGSGAVNAIDLAIVIGYWGTDGGRQYPQADIDGSGEIDGADLATLLGSWGACE